MNWTEGSLVRHSRGRQRNALIARQKQHFAKTRSNLLSGRAKQGPRQNIIPSIPIAIEIATRGLGRNHPTDTRDDHCEVSPANLDRRKRLLEKSDWAGLGLQKPLDITFPGQVYATKRWARVARPPERALAEPSDYATAGGEERRKRLKRSSMRIQIGSQKIRPSIATASQPSTKGYILEPERSPPGSQDSPAPAIGQWMNKSERGGRRYTCIASEDILQASLTPLGGPETPVNVVYSSSVIHEPAPRRNGNFQILQWSPSSSEDRGSMQVEVGRPVRPVPPSQESEQQKWRDWVLTEDDSNLPSHSPLVEIGTSGVRTEDSESSDLTLPSYLQPRLPSLHLSSETEPAPGQSTPGYTITTGGATGIHDYPEDNKCPREHNDIQPSNRKRTPQKKLSDPDNLNSIWMKFALGDEEDSEELLMDAIEEAAHQAAVELRPSDTSSSVDRCTGNAATCGTESSSMDDRYEYDMISNDSSLEGRMATKATIASETASSNIAIVGSTGRPSRDPTRFVMPKAFIGKHVKTDRASTARAFPMNVQRGVARGGKKGRGGRRKIATDGRTDIRNLPDFYGDPIEEIEDD
ncbi:hypothetical protein NUW58_g1933 [Xylaria curta]|uniref:Uncharacterized protein n=1 Tax=Xylaria curta TaxID=42375 RepID=A0ACC1PJC7_9PEZI|nr:hypothetical protein NUW58_g1933 [Xylaria curta]